MKTMNDNNIKNTSITEKTVNNVGYGKPPKEHQWKKGQSGNPSGRPKNSLKTYARTWFLNMTDEEKAEFLEKIPPEMIWKMGEGNPETKSDITSDGKAINFILNDDLNKSDEISPDTKESSTE